MRIERDSIHPALWERIDTYTQAAMWRGGVGLEPVEQAAMAKHQSVWAKQYGKGCALWMAALVGVFITSVGVVPKDMKGFAALASICLILVACIMLFRRNLREITVEELVALSPALRLSPIQQAYVDAIIALKQLKLPKDSEMELVGQLNCLLDEETRLLALRERGVSTSSTPDEIAEEMDDIQKRLAVTTDPVSREALERSAEMCEKRRVAARDLSVVVQRVDAQLTMIAQSIRGMRDSLQRLHSVPVQKIPDINLTPIRETIEHAQEHAIALEAAVSEIQGLG